jgi:hypothetical protein
MDHEWVVTGVAIAASGLTVVSSCADGTVWRWTAGDDSGQRLCDEGASRQRRRDHARR